MYPVDPHTPPTDPVANASLSAELPFGHPVSAERVQQPPHVPDPLEGTSSTRSFVSGNGERLYVGQAPVKRDIPKNKIPKFKGVKVSRFLERYEIEFLARGCTEQDMAFYLPTSVKLDWLQLVRGLPGYATRNWAQLKKSMKDTFGDEEKYKYSLNHLRRFVTAQKRKGRPDKLSRVNRVYLKFAEISTYLKDKKIISEQEESRSFLSLLPEDIVEMFYSRRDMRQLVKNGTEDADEDEENGALPEITEILKELQAIFASFAKRGKISKIRGKHQWDSSDTETDENEDSDESDTEESSETSDSEEEMTHRNKNSHSKSSRSRSHSRSNSHSQKTSKTRKSSKSSESDQGIERMKMPKMRDEVVQKLLSRFDELQVTVAQLAASQAQAATTAAAAVANQAYPRRPPFGTTTSGRPQFPAHQQNPNVSRWNATRRDNPPHEANTTTYESNFTGSGANAIPVGGGPQNQWGNRAPVTSPSAPYIPPQQRAAKPQYAPATPSCLWCAGEDGPPHWMYSCRSLDDAIKSGLVQRNSSGKLHYGMRYIPGGAHPRGMRAWVSEQEEIAKAGAREKNVSFVEIGANSIEYEPPEISEGQGEYEATHVQVDEYEVNAGKRTRSTSDENAPPRKNLRAHRSRESLFEDLGVPKPGNISDRENDVEMKEPAKRRPPASAKPKLESAVESKADTRSVLEKLLQQEITIPMSVMLASSPELAKAMVNECRRKRMPVGDQEVNHVSWTGEEVGNEPQVNLNSYEGSRRGHRSKSYYAGVLAFANVGIEGETLKALLDNGSMICMMQDRVRRRLGLPIRTDGTHKVRMAGGSLETMMGISEDVPVRIGGVTTYVHFFISEGSSNGVLLGQNFLRQVEARFSYHADGSVMMGMTYKGRRITVEVTGKDESRYLTNVPGESREYDSSAIQYVEEEEIPKTRGRTRTREAQRLSEEEASSPTTAKIPAGYGQGRFVESTRISSTGFKVPVYGTRSSSPITLAGPQVPSPAPRYRDEDSMDEEYLPEPPKWRGKRREEQPAETKKEKSAVKEKKPRGKSGPRKNRHWRSGTKDHPPSDDESGGSLECEIQPNEGVQTGGTSRTTGNRGLDEMPATPAIDALLAQAQKIQEGENAIMSESTRQQALQEITETRTGPWITTCTAEEAAERAQEMRDEYDRFLTILFGRRIPLMREDAGTKESNDLRQTLAPERTSNPKAPRVRECGSMMFPIHKQRPLSASLTSINVFENSQSSDSTQGSDGASVSDIMVEPTTDEDLEPTYEDWIDDQHRQIYETQGPEDQSTRPQFPCAQKGDILVQESVFSSASSEQSENEVIRELGLQMANAELTSNFIDLTVEGSSEDEEEDDEEESVSNEFGISEDITFEMLSQAGWRDDDSDEEMYLPDEMDPVSNYSGKGPMGTPELSTEPLLINGVWMTFEMADTDDEEDLPNNSEFIDGIMKDYVNQRVSQELEYAARKRLTRTATSQEERAGEGEDALFTVNSVNLLETDGRASMQFKGEEASLAIAREIRLADTDPENSRLLEGKSDDEKDQFVLAQLREELKKTFYEVSAARLDKQFAEMTAQATEGIEPEGPSGEATASAPTTIDNSPELTECSQTLPETSPDDSPPTSHATTKTRPGRKLKREGAEIWTSGFGDEREERSLDEPEEVIRKGPVQELLAQPKPKKCAICKESTVHFFRGKERHCGEMTPQIERRRPAFEIDNGIRFRIAGDEVMPTAEALEAQTIIAIERGSTNTWDKKTEDEKVAYLAGKRCELALEALPGKQEHEANMCRIPDLDAARELLPEENEESAYAHKSVERPAFDAQVMAGIDELERSRRLLREIREFVEQSCIEDNDLHLCANSVSLEGATNNESNEQEGEQGMGNSRHIMDDLSKENAQSWESASVSNLATAAADLWDDWDFDEKVARLKERREEYVRKRDQERRRRNENLLYLHEKALRIHDRAAAVRDYMREGMCVRGFSPDIDHRSEVGLKGSDRPDETQEDELVLRELHEFVEFTCNGIELVESRLPHLAQSKEEMDKPKQEECENLQARELAGQARRKDEARTVAKETLNPSKEDFQTMNGLCERRYEESLPPPGINARIGGNTIEEDYEEAEGRSNGSDTSMEEQAKEGRRTPTNELVQRLRERKRLFEEEKEQIYRASEERMERFENQRNRSAPFNEDLKCLWCPRSPHGEDTRQRIRRLRHESFERTAQLEESEEEGAKARTYFQVNSVQLESIGSSGKAQPLAKA
ncbi:hypothetical protein P7C70_g169, partial [Phenoliferia sp. Uapishka_3]